jgi:hypothetical protein
MENAVVLRFAAVATADEEAKGVVLPMVVTELFRLDKLGPELVLTSLPTELSIGGMLRALLVETTPGVVSDKAEALPLTVGLVGIILAELDGGEDVVLLLVP